MRQRFILLIAACAAAVVAAPVRADKVTLTGVHLCCKACVRGAETALSKVEGIADVNVDQATKSISFTAKNPSDGLNALYAAGYFGQNKIEGGTVANIAPSRKLEAHEKGKADEVTVQDVHICCQRCQKTIEAIYPEVKVSFLSKTEFKLNGKELDREKVIADLQKAGFNGKIAK